MRSSSTRFTERLSFVLLTCAVAGCGGGTTTGTFAAPGPAAANTPVALATSTASPLPGVTLSPSAPPAASASSSPQASPVPSSTSPGGAVSAATLCVAPAAALARSRSGNARHRDATTILPVNVIGPIASDAPGSPSHNYPWMATDVDLAANGYVEEEYFFCGFSPQGGGTYTTRMIVRRPAAAKTFNGTVLVEWLNVTLGDDLDDLWARSNAHIMKAGYAYVGISVQRTGYYASPYGLALWSPVRYAQLNWPGGDADGAFSSLPDTDPAGYDIYTQALQAMRSRTGANPLPGLPVKYVIATGWSQSASGIVLYYLEQQALYHAADAYLPFNLSTGSTGDYPVNVDIPNDAEVVGTPMLLVNSETDLDNGHYPDSPHFTQWEVAGATHYDEDAFLYDERLQKRDLGIDLAAGDSTCTSPPRSRIPFADVLDAAMDTVVRRLDTGSIPPSQPRFSYNLDGSAMRDAYGNIVGGIRLPQEAVATATNSRDNGTSFDCYLYGSYVPFSQATLNALYASHADYVAKFYSAAGSAVASGVLLPDDAAAGETAAQNSSIP